MRLELIEQNLQLLAQARDLIESLEDTQYRGPGGREGDAGIGPHLRHCIDFYRCFLRDVESGRIDYDKRKRDPRLESERAAALEAIGEIEERLERVGHPERAVQVRVDVSPREAADEAWSPSSVSRELRFLVSHTVHHYALISQRLRAAGRDPGRTFGIAPSTLAYWDRQDGGES